MWTPRNSFIVTPVTPYTQPASNVLSAQTLEYRIRPTRARLEGLLFQFVLTTNNNVACNAEGMAGLVEEVSVELADGLGSGLRTVVKASGPALIDWARANGWKQDGLSALSHCLGMTYANTLSYLVTVPILFRHPLFNEPKAILTSIPMYGKYVSEDMVVRIKLRASTAISATATPFASAYPYLHALFRKVTPASEAAFPGYIPSEFREEVFYPQATGEQVYNLQPGGFLTGVVMRNHTTNAYSSSQAVAGFVNAGATGAIASSYSGKIWLKYGQEILQEFNEAQMLALNAATARNEFSANASSGLFVPGNALYLDLLADFADTDASSIATVLNLNPIANGGDRAQIVFKDWLNANRSEEHTSELQSH